MVEPTTCLVRSLSSSSSLTQQEMNPVRVLGESISFGRFLSESMDWERWSTFTNKRYVEEAEKYSKPGSVAAKKAYFEAHYKRKAQEKVAALAEEANAQSNVTSDPETRDGNSNDTSVEKKSKAGHIVVVEQANKDAVNYQVVDDTNQYESHVGQSVLDTSNVEGATENTAQTCVDMNLNVENHVFDDNSNKEIVIAVEERIPDPGIAGYKVLALPVKGREVNSSLKLPTKITMTKLSHSLNKGKDAAALPSQKSGTMCKKSDKSSFEKIGLTARSLHMSINLPPGNGKGNKIAAAAEQRRNGVSNAFENAGLTARSLRMSINLPPGTGKGNKIAAAAEQRRNGVNNTFENAGLTARSLHMSINLPLGTGKGNKIAAAAEQRRNGVSSGFENASLTARSLHMSINLPPGSAKRNKIAAGAEQPRNGVNSAFENAGLTAQSLHMSKGNKIAAAAEQPRNGVNNVLKSKNSNRNTIENAGLTARSLHMSINLPSGVGKLNNTAAAAEKTRKVANNVLKSKKTIGGSINMKGLTARSLSISAIPPSSETRKSATAAVKPTIGINHTSKITKVVGEPVEKRATSGSLHKSISLPSGASFTSKIPSLFEHNRSKRFVSSLPSVSKHHPMSSQALTKASHGFSNQTLANPPSQGRRTERPLNKSLSGGVTSNAKFSSISECPKSSSSTKSNLRSPTTLSSFRFGSEERALIRKEKVNETKTKEEKKVQLRRIPKDKPT